MQSSISPSPSWFKPSTSTWGDPRLAEPFSRSAVGQLHTRLQVLGHSKLLPL